MARVRAVRRRSTSCGSSVYVSASTSARTGRAPARSIPDDRRYARVGCGDHLVAGRDPGRQERERDRVGPRRNADRVAYAAIAGERDLEPLDLVGKDVPAALEHAGKRGLDVGAGLAAEVEERNRHLSPQ